MVSEQRIVSPRLLMLQNELQANRAESERLVNNFWDEMNSQSTPLIEPLQDDDKHQLLTFIFREEGEVENIVLKCSIAGDDLAKNVLHRLEDTCIYYKSYKVLNGARTTYLMCKNNDLNPDILTNHANNEWQIDPLNPENVSFPFEKMGLPKASGHYMASLLELPDAPLQPWIQRKKTVSRGLLTKHHFQSEFLKNNRKIWVYTPSGHYENAAPFHVLLFFDGWICTDIIPVPTILDNLISAKKIPPTVGIFIGSAKETRNIELTCNPSFIEFVVQEVIPWIREKYQLTKDPMKTVVGGGSFGGLTASFLGLSHPEIVGNVLSLSGSYWWKPPEEEEGEWLSKQFVSKEKLPLKFYLDVGKYESHQQMVVTNRHFRDILKAKGYHVTYSEFIGGHDFNCWRGTFPTGLMTLIGLENEKNYDRGVAR